MARICEKNTCPTGIATHDPKFKAKYKGRPENVTRMLRVIANDVREILAGLGVNSLEEVIGRTDLLRVSPVHEEFVTQRKLSLDFFLSNPASPLPPRAVRGEEPVGDLNRRILEDARGALGTGTPLRLSYPITTADRGVLATLSGELARRQNRRTAHGSVPETGAIEEEIHVEFTGSAGQGFGVFLVDGIHVVLNGEANDSVCKSMSGGSVVIRPHPRSTRDAGESAIIGHCALYGSTGGTLFVHGQAGDRFGVRNSGAVAVVEGTGLHACEYMTRGTIAILGPVSYNVGAGMTGGSVYLRRDQASMINTGYIVPRDMEETDREELRDLITRYWEKTQSPRAKSILEGETDVNDLYFKCVPRPRD